MLHTRFHDNRLTGSREEDFLKVFYLIRTWRPSWSSDLDPANKLSFPHHMGAPHKKMTSIGLVVSEEKMFENVDRRQTTDDRLQTTDGDNRGQSYYKLTSEPSAQVS